jgi:hypothetical protein
VRIACLFFFLSVDRIWPGFGNSDQTCWRLREKSPGVNRGDSRRVGSVSPLFFLNPAAIGFGQCWVLGQTDLDPANRSRLVTPMNTTNFTMSTTALSDLKPLMKNNLMKAKPQLVI